VGNKYTGLLTAILDLVRQREIPDILILPISISYDRTLEESLYARELLGQPKPKESTNVSQCDWLIMVYDFKFLLPEANDINKIFIYPLRDC